MNVSRSTYGPITVVRNGLDRSVYASVAGPGGTPVVLRAADTATDEQMILRAARSCEEAWGKVMPPRLRADLESVASFNPSSLLKEAVRAAATDESERYSRGSCQATEVL